MENENKEIINLTEEELKEVTGGAHAFISKACTNYPKHNCIKLTNCKWENGRCVNKN